MSSATSRLMPTLRRVVYAGAAADRTDGQLLGAFVTDHDADAFAGLVRRHGPMILGVCRRVIGDHSIADDAFQAVFIVLARRASAVKPREQVGNWLYGVAYRTALKARAVLARRRSREKQVEVMPEPQLSDAALAEWADLQPVIDEELARLPDKLRLPVVLCDLEGRAQRDVAKQLAIPPATLATRLASARRTLASRLTKRGVTLSGGALAGLLSIHGRAVAVPHALTQGVTRAAEAVAAGNLVSTLVSAHAVQLSEGVLRMMLLSKLKAVAVTVMTFLTLSGGLGLGLMPAHASGEGNSPANESSEKTAKSIAATTFEPSTDLDDESFLRRLTIAYRGTPPTDVESFFFISDDDADKRTKVTVWLTDDTDVKANVAKKLNVPADRVQVIRIGDGKTGRLVAVISTEPGVAGAAFSPDGTKLAVDVTATANLKRIDREIDLAQVQVVEAVPPASVVRRVRIATEPPAKDVTAPTPGFFRMFSVAQPDAANNMLWLWNSLETPRTQEPQARVWTQNKTSGSWVEVTDSKSEVRILGTAQADVLILNESDVDFLKRVIKDARGTTPTALEEKYFAEDKDPRKREKLLDTLLKDPVVAKRLGDDWKKKMLTAGTPQKAQTFQFQVLPGVRELKLEEFKPIDPKTFKFEVVPFKELQVVPEKFQGQWQFTLPTTPTTPVTPTAPRPSTAPKEARPGAAAPQAPAAPKAPAPKVQAAKVDKFEKLVSELLAVKKSDAEMLEAITLATAGRLPTAVEKKLTLGLVGKAADRKTAWIEVARAMAGGDEAKPQTDAVEVRGAVIGEGGVIELRLAPTVTLPKK